MNIFLIHKKFIIGLMLCFLCISKIFAFDFPDFDVFSIFDKVDKVIWEDGEQYVLLISQDYSKGHPTSGNDHPEQFSKESIANGLAVISSTNKQLFTSNQALHLGAMLSEGLSRAYKGHDIAFAIKDKNNSGALITGRVFNYKGKLNIIFGSSDGKPGSRAEPTDRVFDFTKVTGIKFYESFNKPRRDWLVLNLGSIPKQDRVSIETIPRQKTGDNGLTANINNRECRQYKEELVRIRKQLHEQQERNTEQLAMNNISDKERQQYRLEITRLRKQLKERQQSSIEERLVTLQNLKNKKLITEEEYINRREIIIDKL